MLTSYNGQSFVYDTIGNPTTYRGNTLTWSGGRNLASFSNADNSIAYTYDANGYRATKTVNGVKSTYEYVGNKLVYEKRGNMDIYYFYDAHGNLSAVRYDDTIYYAVCNSRGDVEAFYGVTSGAMHSRYIYDTWGNLIKVVNANGNEITNQNDIAFINPIRYRGYYYDSETGLYYLKSRYYDPEVGRFINADGYVSTGRGVLGHNMFAYCGNNAVNMTDSNGCDPTPAWAIRINAGNATPADYEKALSVNPNSWCGHAGVSVNSAVGKAQKWKSAQTYSLKNNDGSYSLYDNHRKNPNDVFHEQILSAELNGPSISLKDGDLTLGSISVNGATGSWEFEHVKISPLDILHAEAGLVISDDQINATAMASAWSPSITFKLWDIDIKLSANVGAAGFKFCSGKNNFEAGFGAGVGFGISVDF